MKLPQLARKTIEEAFEGKKYITPKDIRERYPEEQACFVTLALHGELRGCIGSLEPRQELWKDVQQNALNAAFRDFRFPPLTKPELKDTKIEVSILSRPKKLEYKTPEELLTKINKKMGIILQKNIHSATFLPQVWEQLPNKVNFLEQLSLKAGLNRDAWKTSEILYYTVNVEKE